MKTTREITFVTPNNNRISVSIYELLDFCRNICMDYISTYPEEKEKFEMFSKNYSYFDPTYDFIICKLKWISYPCLYDDLYYLQSGSDERKKQKKLIPSNIDAMSYNELMLNGEREFTEIYNASDFYIGYKNYHIFSKSIDGYFDENGELFANFFVSNHRSSTAPILNQMAVEIPFVAEDLINFNSTYNVKRSCSFSDYLTFRYGFLSISTYAGRDFMKYDPSNLTLKQSKIIEEYSDMNMPKITTKMPYIDVEEQAAFIKEFRNKKRKRDKYEDRRI